MAFESGLVHLLGVLMRTFRLAHLAHQAWRLDLAEALQKGSRNLVAALPFAEGRQKYFTGEIWVEAAEADFQSRQLSCFPVGSYCRVQAVFPITLVFICLLAPPARA